MKKYFSVFLFLTFGLLISYTVPVTAAVASSTYQYKLKKPPVEVDLSVLDNIGHKVEPEDTGPAIQLLPPPPVVTQAPLPVIIKPRHKAPDDIAAPAAPAKVTQAPKVMAKPFFTAPVIPPAPAVTPAPKTAQPTHEEPSVVPKAADTSSSPVPEASVPAHEEMTVVFGKNSSEIPPSAQKSLDNLVAQLNDLPDMRIQIRAYAANDDVSQSTARRMSLSRGLMVRSYLTDKGIKPTRLDVRALGSETSKTPADRVDLVFVR